MFDQGRSWRAFDIKIGRATIKFFKMFVFLSNDVFFFFCHLGYTFYGFNFLISLIMKDISPDCDTRSRCTHVKLKIKNYILKLNKLLERRRRVVHSILLTYAFLSFFRFYFYLLQCHNHFNIVFKFSSCPFMQQILFFLH